MSMKVNKNGKEYPIGVIPNGYPANRIGFTRTKKSITANSNGIYTSDIPKTKNVFSAYTNEGYMVVPFITDNVWKFQLLTNSGSGFVNGANATVTITIISD